jgi:DNA-binding transcriptional LysR family regulator
MEYKLKNSKNMSDEGPIRLPYFDWDKAKHFYYIAKLGSFSETGKFLNISQPSLSRKISILEDHLKCKLFIRTPKGLDLTRKGEELFAIIERAFLDLKGFSYNAAVTTDNGQKRKFRISTTHAIAAYILNEHLVTYNLLHPEIIFEIITNDQLIDLVINDVDLAIRPYDVEAKGVQQEHLFTLEKRLFASTKYLEEHGIPQNIEDLSYHHIIAPAAPEKHPYSNLDWILTLGNSERDLRKPVFISNSIECLVKAAKNGLGIIGSYEEMEIIREAGLVRILETIKGPITDEYIIYPTYLNKDKAFQEFKKFLLEKLLIFKKRT